MHAMILSMHAMILSKGLLSRIRGLRFQFGYFIFKILVILII